jgi:hypothetical protein
MSHVSHTESGYAGRGADVRISFKSERKKNASVHQFIAYHVICLNIKLLLIALADNNICRSRHQENWLIR